MRHAHTHVNQRAILALIGTLSTCLAGSASAQVIFAGDVDNFGGTNDPDDTLVIGASLASWLARSGSNNIFFHNSAPMPFDEDSDISFNWDFGYTFKNLPTLHQGAKLRIHLKGIGDIPSNDSIHLQYIGDGTSTDFLYSAGLPALNGGIWNVGDEAIFTIPLDAATGGANILSDINAAGYLDVSVLDDTAVDWIELTVPAPGTASLLGLGALVTMRRRR